MHVNYLVAIFFMPSIHTAQLPIFPARLHLKSGPQISHLAQESMLRYFSPITGRLADEAAFTFNKFNSKRANNS